MINNKELANISQDPAICWGGKLIFAKMPHGKKIHIANAIITNSFQSRFAFICEQSHYKIHEKRAEDCVIVEKPKREQLCRICAGKYKKILNLQFEDENEYKNKT